ncbi:P-loop containing nucleoside triphosphate hydrolase protein [Rhodocollybia butyracea]|uniref:P-loop containing nucleoside triphosphate hydrolase protein n=1 Tax=Rhodocollybia butyracea TaxID=206335 RepID=A0A9P5PQS2_9AGAR|nr:P-loop containing nucleoside triphosphate hydrolase protein [Rhodocollybia butyracea]
MTSDISDTVYASRRKELLALINQLRAVGYGALATFFQLSHILSTSAQNDLDLPRITVIGNQSAGKSSVVEAISGITVPRDAGTCTRCPMECRLLSSPGPWTCRISIRKEVGDDGKRLGEVSEKSFGSVITDKSKNTLLTNSECLCTRTERYDAGKKPTFLAKRSLIQNADPDVVKLVEDMVVSHIQGNCIILVAIPMTDDIENQKALRLARQEDETGRRTIGVLTKPDMLGTGSTKTASLWLDVIQGVRHPLMHGYYCTRQPDDDERSAGIAPQQAREAEENFFKTTVPWSRSSHPGRFGTKNLVVTLSRLLVQVIDDKTGRTPPQILEEPATYMLSLVTTFCSEFQTLVHGRADAAELIRTHRQSYATFKRAIRKTAPNFVPFVATEKVTNFNNCLDDEKDDPVANVSSADAPSMDLSRIRRHIEQSLTRELPNNVPYDAKASLIVQFQKTWPKAVDTCFESVEAATLAILFKMIDSHFGISRKSLIETHKQNCDAFLAATIEAELMPYTQNDHYLQSTTQGWLEKYKAVRSRHTEESTGSAVNAGTSTFENAAPSTSKGISTDLAGGTFNFGGSASKRSTMDRSFPPNPNPFGPFFENPSFATPKAPSLPAFSSAQPASATNIQKPTFTATHQDPQIDETAFQEAIAMLIKAVRERAEGDGGSQRLLSSSVQDLLFVRELGKTLQPVLISKFGMGTPSANERCASYLGEDPALVLRREELSAKKKRLESVEKELDEYSLRV